MSHKPINDLITQIVTDGALSLTKGTNIFPGMMKASPENAVFVFSTSGPEPARTMGTIIEVRSALVTVQLRWNKESTGYDKIRDIQDSLKGVDISGYLHVVCTQGEPTLAFRDTEGNVVFTLLYVMVYLAP